jgi:hypothetical protein
MTRRNPILVLVRPRAHVSEQRSFALKHRSTLERCPMSDAAPVRRLHSVSAAHSQARHRAPETDVPLTPRESNTTRCPRSSRMRPRSSAASIRSLRGRSTCSNRSLRAARGTRRCHPIAGSTWSWRPASILGGADARRSTDPSQHSRGGEVAEMRVRGGGFAKVLGALIETCELRRRNRKLAMRVRRFGSRRKATPPAVAR